MTLTVKEHFYNTRFTFYGHVLYFEYALEAETRYSAVKFFLQDESNDAYVSVQCCKRDDTGWTAEHTMFNQRVCAGSVSEFVTSCRAFVDAYFNKTDIPEEAMIAAMVINDEV